MISRRIRIVLQARTTSNRLPAKVLLPVGGLPLAVLCAKRLGNQGHDVVLAISNEATDHLLASIVHKTGTKTFRGDLHDVLSRFVACTTDLDDNDILIRATADNPLPDGAFIERLVSAFEVSGGDYLGTSSPTDGLPYGLSAEVFTAGALRKTASEQPDAFIREHVTAALSREAGSAGIVPRGWFLEHDHSSLRVTIDTLDDYLAIAPLFENVVCPATISWHELVKQLSTQGK